MLILARNGDRVWAFNRAVDEEAALLYAMDSPNASGARGFARGQLFTEDGTLVASTAQEGLIRVIDQPRATRSDPRLQV